MASAGPCNGGFPGGRNDDTVLKKCENLLPGIRTQAAVTESIHQVRDKNLFLGSIDRLPSVH